MCTFTDILHLLVKETSSTCSYAKCQYFTCYMFVVVLRTLQFFLSFLDMLTIFTDLHHGMGKCSLVISCNSPLGRY